MNPPATDTAALDAAQAELAQRIARSTPAAGVHATAIGRLRLYRVDAPSLPLPTVYEPCLCIVAQGRKQALLDGRAYVYDPLHYLVVSVTLPVSGHIIEATPEKPFLSVRIALDAAEIGQLVLGAPTPPAESETRGVFLARTQAPLLDAVLRLLRLLETPNDIAALSPLVLHEIVYRVLTGELGHRLRQVALAGSRTQRIQRVIPAGSNQID